MDSFEEWLNSYMPNRLHDKFALFSLEDMRNAFEAGIHADIHTDNSTVISSLQKQIGVMKSHLVDACEICAHRNEKCTDCGKDNEKWEIKENVN